MGQPVERADRYLVDLVAIQRQSLQVSQTFEHVPPQRDFVVRRVQLVEIDQTFPHTGAESDHVIVIEYQRLQTVQVGERAVLDVPYAVVLQIEIRQLVQVGEVVFKNLGQLIVADVEGGRVGDFEECVLGDILDPEALEVQLYILDRLHRVHILERDAVQHAVPQAHVKMIINLAVHFLRADVSSGDR